MRQATKLSVAIFFFREGVTVFLSQVHNMSISHSQYTADMKQKIGARGKEKIIGYTLSNGGVPLKKIILHCKYYIYLHQTNAIVFTILSAIERANIQMSSFIINNS